MRIVVVSDSHGSRYNLFSALEREKEAEILYFLGDGANEFYDLQSAYGDKVFMIGVKGNCDLACKLPIRDVRTLEGKRIYATHGYMEQVKLGLYDLECNALSEKADIVLFGHTHNPENFYKDGVYYFNPGSVREGFYGVIDITPKGVICIEKNLIY